MKAAGALAAALLLLAGGYAAADAQDVVPGPLTTRRVIPEPEPRPVLTVAPVAVPDLAGDLAPLPVGDLQGLVDELAADVSPVSVTLLDASSGAVVGAVEPATPRPPASSLKLLTAAAALQELGPDHVLATTATWDGTTLTLVGGGDLLLVAGPDDDGASLTDLAGQVAGRLGTATVRLAVDDSLFTGPAHAADWGPIDREYVMPMAALAVGAGRSDGTSWDADPAVAAAEVLAGELEAAGVTVGGEIARAVSPPGATEIGRVVSAPLSEVVRHTLKVSDNSVAEALGRLVSLARGGPGSAEHATVAVVEVLGELGVATDGVVLGDTSGLSDTTRVTTDLLAEVLLLSLDPAHPRLQGLVPALPVANLDGTLAERIEGAAGAVRAKTGTLLSVVSLSGVVRTDAGGTVVFSVVLPELTGGTAPARARLDEFITAVAASGG